MSSEIIVIGAYSAQLAHVLDYSAERYAATREGATISRRLFGIAEGSSVSTELALLFGITDPWDFNQHRIVATKINIAGLREFGRRYPEYSEDVEAIEILRKARFEFHFRPEG